MADPADRELVENTGTPRWVIVSVVIAFIVVLVVVMMLVFGHGPGRHAPSGETPAVLSDAGRTSPSGRHGG